MRSGKQVALRVFLLIWAMVLAFALVPSPAGACSGIKGCLETYGCSGAGDCVKRFDPVCSKDSTDGSCECVNIASTLRNTVLCVRPPRP